MTARIGWASVHLLRGLTLGIGAAAPIGPVNVEMARRTLRFGFMAGAALGVGAVSVDVTYALLSSLSLGEAARLPAVRWPIGIAGFVLLVYMGAGSLRSMRGHLDDDALGFAATRSSPTGETLARAADAVDAQEGLTGEKVRNAGGDEDVRGARAATPTPSRGDLSCDALGLTRQSAARSYRAGVLMTLLNPMTLVFWFIELPSQGDIIKDSTPDLPMICAGVFIGTLAWVIVFCGLLGFLGRWRRNWWLAAADGIGGAMLLILAFAGLWHLLATPL